MEQGLRTIPAWKLDKFIEDYLFPDTPFGAHVKSAISVLSDFLKERCFQGAAYPVRVSKGHSSGKGTSLKGRSETDLVVFLDNLTRFQVLLNQRGEFIKEIKKRLYELQCERHFGVKFEVQSSWWPNARTLSFKLSAPHLHQEVEFDVLPAFDVLEHPNSIKPSRQQFYSELIHECTTPESEGNYSLSFVELQNNFLEDRPPKLKKLICLVKYWHQLCMEKLGKPVPPRYALELLTVYAWEHGSGVADFSIAQGFRTVLKLITKYEYLIIYWTVYYDFQHGEVSDYLRRQLQKDRPIILDPADPTRNIAGCTIMGWYFLADLAEEWLDYPCFKNRDGSQVRSWKVLTEVPGTKQQVTRNFFSRSYFSFPVSP
ncbi:2'-5'-oligoadenylate synthase 1A-like isoform X4 [Mastomys coucha]|uniref:2'-5'-oligoadenylate synthase 1A-like isoform X4 n=1 Tax=Mastomys coucha TaxID=35658 RepID=UPI0012624A62|nr:2'-5'-oligoadenylate synthase 1A-like isoform X4 [Mastomys coucha]